MEKEDDWVELVGPVRGRFISVLQTGIAPSSYRKFDRLSKRWLVHYTKIYDLVQLARRFYDYVDYSSLPVTWQLFAAGAEVKKERRKTKTNSYEKLYSILFLTPDAPEDIIKVVFKTLAKKYHPDVGGDEEQFKKLNNAYSKILDLLKCQQK